MPSCESGATSPSSLNTVITWKDPRTFEENFQVKDPSTFEGRIHPVEKWRVQEKRKEGKVENEEEKEKEEEEGEV